MAWIETAEGDFVNLAHVSELLAEAETVDGDSEEPTETGKWIVNAYLDYTIVSGDNSDWTQVFGIWDSEKGAQAWIRGMLTNAGEKVIAQEVLNPKAPGWMLAPPGV